MGPYTRWCATLLVTVLITLAGLGGTASVHAEGDLDPAFGNNGVINENPSTARFERVRGLAAHNDGLFVTGTYFVAGNNAWVVEKRNLATGALDPAFGESAGVLLSAPNPGTAHVNSIAANTCGLFITGRDDSFAPEYGRLEKRDPATGMLDADFGDNGVIAWAPGPNGGGIDQLIVRGNQLFGLGGRWDPEAVAATWFIERRNTATGQLDPQFGGGNGFVELNPAVQIKRMRVDHGMLFMFGETENAGGTAVSYIEKRSARTGSLDTAFGDGTGVITLDQTPFKARLVDVAIDVQSVFLFHRLVYSNEYALWRIEKRDAVTGKLDAVFGDGTGFVLSEEADALDNARRILLDGDRLYIIGDDRDIADDIRPVQWRIERRSAVTGALDPGFGAGTGVVWSNPSTADDSPMDALLVENGLVVGGYDEQIGEPGREIERDHQWRLEKRRVTTAHAHISPDLCACTISPQGNPRSNSTLAAHPGAMSSSVVDVLYQWFVNDEPVPAPVGDNERLPPSSFNGGDTVTVHCTATDGSMLGPTVTDTVVIADDHKGGCVAVDHDAPVGGLLLVIASLFLLRRRSRRFITTIIAAMTVFAVAGPARADGDLDPSFGNDGAITVNPTNSISELIHDIAVDDTGVYITGADRSGVWHVEKRSRTTGAPDPQFGGGAGAVFTNPGPYEEDAKVLALGCGGLFVGGTGDASLDEGFRVERRDPTTGAYHPTFGNGAGYVEIGAPVISRMLVSGGALYVASYASPNFDTQWRLEKREAESGELDSVFGNGTGVIVSNPTLESDRIHGLVIHERSLYVAGTQDEFGDGTTLGRIEKRDAKTGALDPVFGGGSGVVTIDLTPTEMILHDIAVDPTSIYVLIRLDLGVYEDAWRVEKRSLTTGALEPVFGGGVGFITTNPSSKNDYARHLLLDGELLYIIGDRQEGAREWYVERRFTDTGLFDTSFGGGAGYITSSPSVHSDHLMRGALGGDTLFLGGHDSVFWEPDHDWQWRLEKRRVTTSAPTPDTEPQLCSCFIAPQGNPNANSTLVGVYTGASANVSDVLFQWFVNDTPVPAPLGRHRHLPPSRFVTGDAVTLHCTPTDGVINGPTLTDTVTVESGPPGHYDSAAPSHAWNLLSAPLVTGDHVTDDLSYVYQWDETRQAWTGGQTGGTPTAIPPGHGVMGYVTDGDPFPLGGTPVDADGSEVSAADFDITGLTVSGGPNSGLHLLGNPFNAAIWWQNMRVRPAGVGSYVDVGAAAANGWIENNAWVSYDNTAGNYRPFQGGGFDGGIAPWQAFWIRALVPIDIRIPASQPAPAASLTRAASSDSWTVTLSAVSDHLRDRFNGFGVAADAANGWDYHDATDAGTLNAEHVVLSFPSDDSLAFDIRPGGVARTWTARVSFAGTGPVTLSWDNVPTTAVITLTDTSTGAATLLNEASSYTYTPENIETREFTITAKPATAEGSPVAASINPSASSAGCVAASGGHGGAAIVLVVGMALLRRRR